MWKEFKKFAFKGNVIDLAVGVIIGGAFGAIVSSLVNDIIMPVIGLIFGTKNLDKLFWILKVPEGVDKATLTTLDLANEAGATVMTYGAFIAAIVNFILIAIVLFLVIKGINKATELTKKKEEEAPAKPARICPYCKQEIADDATRCPHCTSELPKEE